MDTFAGGGAWFQEFYSFSAGPSDVGSVFALPADKLLKFDWLLSSGLGILIDPKTTSESGELAYFGQAAREPYSSLSSALYVATPGPGLHGFRFTSIESTVDDAHVEFADPSHPLSFANHTVRFYGYAIPPLAGDFNGDGRVDTADYVLWRERVENYGPLPNGSGQGIFAGVALPEDYAYWRARVGNEVIFENGSGAFGGVVPEPNSWLLLIVGLSCLRVRHGTTGRATPSGN